MSSNETSLNALVSASADGAVVHHEAQAPVLSSALLVQCMHQAPCGLGIVDSQGNGKYLNERLKSVLLLTDSPKNNVFTALDPKDADILAHAVSRTLKSGQCFQNIEVRAVDNGVVHRWLSVNVSKLELDGHTYATLATTDITARKHAELELTELATRDHLTGLANRRVFDEALERALAVAKRYNRGGAILYVDIDAFKLVNDTYGHAIGDKVLVEVAGVLNRLFRSSDVVARIGGDEFSVILSEVSPREAKIKAKLVQRAIQRLNVMANDIQLNISASIGLQLFHNELGDKEAVLAAADAAMYLSKSNRQKQAH